MSDTHDRLCKDSRLKRYTSLSEMIGDAENPTPIVASGVAVAVAPDSSLKAPSYLEQMLADEDRP